MASDTDSSTMKVLKVISGVSAAIGCVTGLVVSRFVGMAAGAIPWATALTTVLLAGSILIRYFAFRSGGKNLLLSPLWLRLSNFVSVSSSSILTLMILYGYLFHPTVSKSFVADWTAYFLIASLFVMGLAINSQDWKRIVLNPKVIGISIIMRWVCVPLAAYGVAYLSFIKLLPGPTGTALAIGMILLGATPTGGASNTLTMVAEGDLALSVSVTTINTMLSPFLLPLITLLLAGSMTHVDAVGIFKDLLEMVILPVGLGSILGSVFVKHLSRLKPVLGAIAVICLGFIMMGTISRGAGIVLAQLYILPYLGGGCILLAVVSYAMGYYISKLAGFDMKQRKAACFEVAITNGALTMTIAARHFGPLAVIVAIVYTKVMVIMGAVVMIPLFKKIDERETRQADARPVVVPAAN